MRRFLITLLCFTPCLAQAQLESTSDLQRGLVGWWRFNEGTGTNAFDLSGNNNTGALSGSTLPVWTNGVFGGALKFDGANAYINIPNSSVFSYGSNNFSFTFWVRLERINVTQGIYHQADVTTDTPGPFTLFVMANNELISDVSNNGLWTSYVTVTNTTPLTLNTWRFAAAVRNGSTLTMYSDGVASGSGDISSQSPLYSSSQPVKIGYWRNGDHSPFNGKLDDFRIYNRALSATEVLNLYCQGGGRTP